MLIEFHYGNDINSLSFSENFAVIKHLNFNLSSIKHFLYIFTAKLQSIHLL